MISIDVDVDDILWGLGSRDQKELLEGLLDQMDPDVVLKIIKGHEDYRDKSYNIHSVVTGDNASFTEACELIAANRWRLPLEQEQLILQIADKL